MATTYSYQVEVEYSFYFPNTRGGPSSVPMGTLTTIITSSRRLPESVVCNAAMTRLKAQGTQMISGSANLSQSGAQISLDNCFVYPMF